MRETAWLANATALGAEHARRLTSADEIEAASVGCALPRPHQLRTALVELVRLFQSAPTPIEDRYKSIPEAVLRAAAEAATARLQAGSLAWSADEPLLAAAAQARAVDRFLLDHSELRGRPTDPNVDYLCSVTDTLVIPRPEAAPPLPEKVKTRTFARRGLVWHRLIPTEISGYDIHLEWHRDLFVPLRRQPTTVLSALFEDLRLVGSTEEGGFVATDAPCANEIATLQSQIAALRSSDARIAVWPELTMPPERRKVLSDLLRQASLEVPPSALGCIVAAGSWHEVSGSEVRNRMHVLSASGTPRLFHDKSIAMESGTLGKERLTPSFRIPVLITKDALVTFAICRDFCEGQISRIYALLDVDVVVVPSYGDRKTINAHKQQAANLQTGPGTRSFVVQQVVPEEVATSASGYVLPPDADATALHSSDLYAEPPGDRHPMTVKRV